MDAATDLFSRKGFHNVSVREITRKVGIKESSLYNHFDSKDEVLEEILNRFQSEFASLTPSDEVLREVFESHDQEQYLCDWFMRFIQFWNDPRREKIWFIASMEQHRNKRVAEMILQETSQLLDVTETVFRKLIEKKRIRSFDPKLLAAEYIYTLRAMYLEYRLLKVTKRNTEDIEKLMSDYIEPFLGRIKIAGN